MNKKICCKCHIEKDKDDFDKNKAKKDGLHHACKKCRKLEREKSKVKRKEYDKKYYIENLAKRKEYETLNKDEIKKRHRDYFRKRLKEDVVFKIKNKIRVSINQALKKTNTAKRIKSVEILGCSYEEFKYYLESKFESWMTWENYGKYNGSFNFGWDMDHIIPLSSAITENDVVKLNHYTNIQPLCSKINRDIKKDNK